VIFQYNQREKGYFPMYGYRKRKCQKIKKLPVNVSNLTKFAKEVEQLTEC
jgi:hypothetical protein